MLERQDHPKFYAYYVNLGGGKRVSLGALDRVIADADPDLVAAVEAAFLRSIEKAKTNLVKLMWKELTEPQPAPRSASA